MYLLPFLYPERFLCLSLPEIMPHAFRLSEIINIMKFALQKSVFVGHIFSLRII